ncbi:MAG TPA: hypothetical protein P5081_22650 [Phycisphaerae bacterium]|nr:hypothetical protein [Phycisphaerae bacterium]HRW55683.1 hypothetical protein [Phycisphaerae bacterium]
MNSQSVIRLVAAMLLCCAGCAARTSTLATRVEIPDRSVDRSSYDLTDLGLALNRVVDGERLRPRSLLESRPLIDAYLAQVAVVGPESTPALFPTDETTLAYTLNCQSAALLRSLLALSTPESVPERAPAGFERRFAFMIDGEWRTPADLRARAKLFAWDDWRVTLALPTITSDGPAILSRPFLPELLGAQLDKVARDAFASPRVVRVDHGEIKQILFWRELWALRHQLIADYERRYETSDGRMLNVLLVWADSGFQRVTLNSAVGYSEQVMPADSHIPWNGVIVSPE